MYFAWRMLEANLKISHDFSKQKYVGKEYTIKGTI